MFGKNKAIVEIHRIDKTEVKGIYVPMDRYEELLRAEAERDIIVKATEAEPSYAISSVVKAVATVREEKAKEREAQKTPAGDSTEAADA